MAERITETIQKVLAGDIDSYEEIVQEYQEEVWSIIAFTLHDISTTEDLVQEGGILVANQSLMNRGLARQDIRGVLIPVSEIAEDLGNKQMANMVAVGALLAHLPVLSVEAVEKALEDHLPPRKQQWIPANSAAIHKGYAFVKEAVSAQGW